MCHGVGATIRGDWQLPLCGDKTPSKMPPLAVGRPGQDNRELLESSLRSIVAGRSWPQATLGSNWSP